MQFLTLPRFSKLHSLDVSESDIGYLSVENIGKIIPGLKGNSLLKLLMFWFNILYVFRVVAHKSESYKPL